MTPTHIRSATWTGRERTMWLPRPMAFLWWLSVGLRAILCPHVWAWDAQRCRLCGVDACEIEDFSWRFIPTARPRSPLFLDGRDYRGIEI